MIISKGTISEEVDSELTNGIKAPSSNNEAQEESTSSDFVDQPENWQCLDYPTPLEFIAFFDPHINKGDVTLYPWQAEILEELGTVKPTLMNPYKFCLCAANGSGKDAFVIAPFSIWFICCKVRSLVIITSASATQLNSQTEKYIVSFAKRINSWALETGLGEIIKIRKHRITCTSSGSEILLFATDEGAKAEGYHPVDPNSEMAIIVNEAKSITPEIFFALQKCTGFNYWIDVSTPGEPQGHFYRHFHSDKWNKRRVTFYDCLRHQSLTEFNAEKEELGEDHPHFRSKWLALFTSVGGKTVVNQLYLERLRRAVKNNAIPLFAQNREIRIGIDVALSTHGDETVISAFRGNKQINLLHYKIKDAFILAENIQRDLLSKVGVKQDHAFIFIDDGNVGRAVADILRRQGWSGINRILNNSPAKNSRMYRNRGAEMWGKMAKLIENQCLILIDDDILYQQIQSRKYKETIAGIDRLQLESKPEVKSEGLSSPDRADATALALIDTNVDDFINKAEYRATSEPLLTEEQHLRQLQSELDKLGDDLRPPSNQKARFSLNALLGRTKSNGRLLKWK